MFAVHVASGAVASGDRIIRAPGIAVEFSAHGNVTGLEIGAAKEFIPIRAWTYMYGCSRTGTSTIRRLANNGLKFTQPLIDIAQKRHCVLTQIFTPSQKSVRWQVSIRSRGAAWSTSINSAVALPSCGAIRTIKTRNWNTAFTGYGLAYPPGQLSAMFFWTSWAAPVPGNSLWQNPLRPRHFANHTWVYRLSRTRGLSFSIPLASVLQPTTNSGFSLALSPRDVIIGLSLTTYHNGAFVFSRTHFQLGGGKVVRLTMHLVPQQASWRSGLQWMVRHYPKFFNPPNPAVNQMAGCGAYTGYEDPINLAKFKAMAFRTLWQLCDDLPYQGMFIPPVTSNTERWHRGMEEPNPPGKPDWMTCRRLEQWAKYLKTNGFNLLMYFNASEFGKNMKSPVRHKPNTPDLWKYPRAFLKYDFPHAALSHSPSCYNALVMDCGDPAYRKFLLGQAARMIKRVPDAAGICIDRLDWVRLYDHHMTDGVSFANGKPVQSLLQSFKGLMAKLGPMMHNAGKVIFVNGIGCPRLDVMRHVDGIDSEGDTGPDINEVGMLCLRKPAILWTYTSDDLKPDPDAYFQRHLYMGVYPYAPYPWNNHSIQPDAWADRYYLDYGPLLNAMRGKQWVLTPHCVTVNNPRVLVNLFRVPSGYVAPVVLGGKVTSVLLTIRNVAGLSAKDRCEALYPGKPKPAALSALYRKGALAIRVRLVRGCAMVKISH